MEVIDVLRNASRMVYQNVKGMAGTDAAAGHNGIGAGGDVSRNIDILAERTVLDYLREIDFGCVVLGEECGRVEIARNPGGYVIMDAIDGSANAVRGVPFFCCSLAFATGDRLSSITDGVVTDLSSGDQYWASRGAGCFMNKERIGVRGGDPVYKIVGINTSGAGGGLMRRLEPVFANHNHLRHFGANALEMAMFARGLMDVCIDLRGRIRVQDLAAGYILVKEAGGLILDGDFEPLDSDLSYKTRLSFVAAANRRILDEVAGEIRKDVDWSNYQAG